MTVIAAVEKAADFAACPDADDPEVPADLTYCRDVRPIHEARCAGCHLEGGIAPFALTSYDDAFHCCAPATPRTPRPAGTAPASASTSSRPAASAAGLPAIAR